MIKRLGVYLEICFFHLATLAPTHLIQKLTQIVSLLTSEQSLSDFSSPESEAELTGDDEDINRPGACHRC